MRPIHCCNCNALAFLHKFLHSRCIWNKRQYIVANTGNRACHFNSIKNNMYDLRFVRRKFIRCRKIIFSVGNSNLNGFAPCGYWGELLSAVLRLILNFIDPNAPQLSRKTVIENDSDCGGTAPATWNSEIRKHEISRNELRSRKTNINHPTSNTIYIRFGYVRTRF